MTKSEAKEFGFVDEMPKREQTRWQTLWGHFEDIRTLVSANGMLVPVKLAADLGGVSPQRIHQLCDSGKLVRVDVQGHPFIGENSFLAWAKSERKTGRPLKLPERDFVKALVEVQKKVPKKS